VEDLLEAYLEVVLAEVVPAFITELTFCFLYFELHYYGVALTFMLLLEFDEEL
jgi:hypothetical protein